MFVHNCYCPTKYFISFESSPSEPFLQNCNRFTQYFIKSDLPEGWSVALELCGSYSFSPASHSPPPYPPDDFCEIDPVLNSLISKSVKAPSFPLFILKLLLCFFKIVTFKDVWQHRLHSKGDLLLVWKFIIFIMTLKWWALPRAFYCTKMC